MGGRKLGDYPRNLGEFYHRFHDEDACLRYLTRASDKVLGRLRASGYRLQETAPFCAPEARSLKPGPGDFAGILAI